MWFSYWYRNVTLFCFLASLHITLSASSCASLKDGFLYSCNPLLLEEVQEVALRSLHYKPWVLSTSSHCPKDWVKFVCIREGLEKKSSKDNWRRSGVTVQGRVKWECVWNTKRDKYFSFFMVKRKVERPPLMGFDTKSLFCKSSYLIFLAPGCSSTYHYTDSAEQG